MDQNKTKISGTWKDSILHGHAELKFASGASFDGNFKEGLMDGFGVWKGAGYVSQDHLHGPAMDAGLTARKFCRGEIYKGEWKNSYTHGIGEFTWADGNKYKGEWHWGVCTATSTVCTCAPFRIHVLSTSVRHADHLDCRHHRYSDPDCATDHVGEWSVHQRGGWHSLRGTVCGRTQTRCWQDQERKFDAKDCLCHVLLKADSDIFLGMYFLFFQTNGDEQYAIWYYDTKWITYCYRVSAPYTSRRPPLFVMLAMCFASISGCWMRVFMCNGTHGQCSPFKQSRT